MVLTNASVACMRDGRVLLIQRSLSESSFAGYWEFPGGGIEPGETPAGAAAREFREECGCDVIIGRQIAEFSWLSDGVRRTEVVFSGPPVDEIRLDSDHCAHAWARYTDLVAGRYKCSPEILSIATTLLSAELT